MSFRQLWGCSTCPFIWVMPTYFLPAEGPYRPYPDRPDMKQRLRENSDRKEMPFFKSIGYLKHFITTGNSKVANKTREAFMALNYNRITTSLRSITGLYNDHGKLVLDFVEKAAPPIKRFKKWTSAKYELQNEGRAAVSDLKQNLAQPKVRALR